MAGGFDSFVGSNGGVRYRGLGEKRRAQQPTEACQSDAPTATTD
jgi:hypothetical protein